MKYLLTLLILTNFAWANQRIEIKEGLVSKAGNVYFDDIAEIDGFTEKSKKQLSSLLVAADLKEGELRKISDLALTDLLRRSLAYVKNFETKAGKEFNLVLKMPKVLELYLNSPHWTERKLSKLLKDHNQGFCQECSFEISALRLPKAEKIKVSNWELEIPDQLLKGNFQIPLRVYRLGNGEAETHYISGRMRTYKVLPVARRNIAPGERINDSDILFEKREMNFVRKDIPTKSELLGAKAKRMALSGSILWLSNLEKEKAVERGDLVDIIIRRNNMEMRLKGVAQEAGFIGDRVSILNRSSRKVIVGEVTNPHEVVIQ
ncbi:MAG: flagellar basal body P-ring formation chaperone FlgA [Bdellovibrionota bacterium]|nr:flagellar basal body P-ring formation chaperone FlgA [Bdellovibrionota bacterium]